MKATISDSLRQYLMYQALLYRAESKNLRECGAFMLADFFDKKAIEILKSVI